MGRVVTETRHFDMIVVGAGPAGAAAAHTAARAGRSVALVDKARFPRDKLCGGGFTGRAARYYEEIFERPLPPEFTAHDAVSFFAFGTRIATIDDIPPIYMTMRLDLDNLLFGHAVDAGAADWTGQRIAAIDPDGPSLTLASGTRLTADVLIGADGVHSQTARALFGRAFDPDRIGFGLEVEAPPAPAGAPLRIDFGQAIWGYGWSFPKPGSHTIGVGGVLSKNPDLAAVMRDYTETLGAGAEARVKGHHLPFGGARKRPGRGPVLLAGDAAWLVDPITGEGIAYAMKSGQWAAQAALEALRRREPEMALQIYRHKLRPIRRAIAQACWIRLIIYWGPFRTGFVEALRRSGNLRRDYMRVLGGELEYDTLSLRLLRRLPDYLRRALGPRSAPEPQPSRSS